MTRILIAFLCGLTVASPARPQNVLTANYDLDRTSADTSETALNPASVNATSFGKLFALPVDGKVYAQPLYEKNITLPNKTKHNIVFMATAHNTVFAFDADKPMAPLWTAYLGPSVPASAWGDYTDIWPEVGIIGTPVISSSSQLIYVVAATLESGVFYYRLHALNASSGVEAANSPVVISASVAGSGDDSSAGSVPFVSGHHIQRPGLLLLNGYVYVAFGSHADDPPYHGWILAYNTVQLTQPPVVFNVTPNGSGGAFWQSGRAPAADSKGNIYVVSSNGNTDTLSDYSDSVLRLTAATLTLQDWFEPYNVQYLDDNDEDLGSAGPVLIPGTNLLVTGGKSGSIYLMNAQSLGGTKPGNSQILQTLSVGVYGVFNMALWNRTGGQLLFVPSDNNPIQAYELSSNLFYAASATSAPYSVPYEGMTISANGGQTGTGILWVTTTDLYGTATTGTLHAFNAEDLTQELWNSSVNPGDALGLFNKFTNPTVANGKVYMPGGSDEVTVFGLLSAAPAGVPPSIASVVNGASYGAGPLAPGEVVAIFGQDLGPAAPTFGAFDGNGYVVGELGGSVVTFNGFPAPLLYSSANQVDAVVPFEVAGADSVTVQADFRGTLSNTVLLQVATASPGIFSANASGSGQGLIVNQDGSINSAAHPAVAGSYVTLYATGGGQTNPADNTGFEGPLDPQSVAAPVTATIGGVQAGVGYAGNAPGELNGLMQINLQIPAALAGAGSVPVVLSMGQAQTLQNVTVAVQ